MLGSRSDPLKLVVTALWKVKVLLWVESVPWTLLDSCRWIRARCRRLWRHNRYGNWGKHRQFLDALSFFAPRNGGLKNSERGGSSHAPLRGFRRSDLHASADAKCPEVLRALCRGERLLFLRARNRGPGARSTGPVRGYQEGNMPFRLPCTDLPEMPPVFLRLCAKFSDFRFRGQGRHSHEPIRGHWESDLHLPAGTKCHFVPGASRRRHRSPETLS